jgi:serine/threonine kinase 16
LISNENKLVLFDFGSVAPARHLITSRKEALSLQEWATSHCTPLFKAPELFDVQSDAIIDERTDVWVRKRSLTSLLNNSSLWGAHCSPWLS